MLAGKKSPPADLQAGYANLCEQLTELRETFIVYDAVLRDFVPTAAHVFVFPCDTPARAAAIGVTNYAGRNTSIFTYCAPKEVLKKCLPHCPECAARHRLHLPSICGG